MLKKLVPVISLIILLSTGLVSFADVSPTIIHNGSLDGIKQYIISEFLPLGWNIEKDKTNSLQFTKTLTDITASLFFGSSFSNYPEGRVSFNFFKKAEGVGVIPQLELITNPGSAFEKTSLVNPEKDMTKMKDFLRKVKTVFDGGVGTGVSVKREEDNTTTVKTVLSGSNAERQGLHVGEKVIKINNTAATEVRIDRIHRKHLWAEKGHSVTLTVRTKSGDIKKVRLTNQQIPPQHQLIAQYCPEKEGQANKQNENEFFTGEVGKVEGFESTVVVQIPDRNVFEIACLDGSVRFAHGQENIIDKMLSRALFEYVIAGEKNKNFVRKHIGTLGNNFKVYLWSQDNGQDRWIEILINEHSVKLGRDETLKLSKILKLVSRKLEGHR